MKTRIMLGIAAVVLAATALTGCAASGDDATPADAPASTAPETSGTDPYAAPDDSAGGTADAAATSLATADTDLGTIVVDGKGMAVYQYDADTQGADSSACAGDCAQAWPAVPGDASIDAEGITGELGSITGIDGKPQVTLNGWPLYYYAGDQAAGDTTGQAFGDVWWVVDADGEPIH